jgi:hypothetical protein
MKMSTLVLTRSLPLARGLASMISVEERACDGGQQRGFHP